MKKKNISTSFQILAAFISAFYTILNIFFHQSKITFRTSPISADYPPIPSFILIVTDFHWNNCYETTKPLFITDLRKKYMTVGRYGTLQTATRYVRIRIDAITLVIISLAPFLFLR